LKIDISPYLSEKSSVFDGILYTAADFELDERHVIKNEKVALDRLRVRQNVFLVCSKMYFSSDIPIYSRIHALVFPFCPADSQHTTRYPHLEGRT